MSASVLLTALFTVVMAVSVVAGNLDLVPTD